jgi:hypothetical protein
MPLQPRLGMYFLSSSKSVLISSSFSQIKKRLIEKANDGGVGPSTPVKAKSTHAKKSPGSGKKSGSGINTTPFRVMTKTKSSMIGSNDLKDIKEESVHSGDEGDAEDDN